MASKIPTKEEFKRAAQEMRDEQITLDAISTAVVATFTNEGVERAFLLPQIDVDFRAYVFVSTDSDLRHAKRVGLRDKIDAFVRARLNKSQCTLDLELDSDENVQANYEGDYNMRLH